MPTSGRQVLEIGILTGFSNVFQSWNHNQSHQKQTWEMLSESLRKTGGGVGLFAVCFKCFLHKNKKKSHFLSGTFLLWFTRLPRQPFIISFSSLFSLSHEHLSSCKPKHFFFWHSTAFFPAKLLFSEDFSTCSWVVLKMFSDFHNQSCRVHDSLL